MEDAGANSDEEGRGETVARSGPAEWRGNELATVHFSGGESHVDRLASDESADGGMSRTEEDAVELKEKDESRDAREGIVVNGTGDQRTLQPSSSGLQSTLKLGDAVEDDARAVAESLTALLASLKAALSEVTRSSLEHMRSENMAAGQVQDVAVDAATKGNRFINSCLRDRCCHIPRRTQLPNTNKDCCTLLLKLEEQETVYSSNIFKTSLRQIYKSLRRKLI